jgi:hypothetical protein
MTGKSHLAANIGTAIYCTNAMVYAVCFAPPMIAKIANEGLHYFAGSGDNTPLVLYIIASVGFYLLGTLLPDIDKDTSMISQIFHFHIPIEHHTWTHLVYWALAFIPLGLVFRPIMFLPIGYVLHLVADSFSVCGNCWFVLNYRRYGDNGAKVKKGHILKLYQTGKASEYVLVSVFFTLAVVMCIYFYKEDIYRTALDVII